MSASEKARGLRRAVAWAAKRIGGWELNEQTYGALAGPEPIAALDAANKALDEYVAKLEAVFAAALVIAEDDGNPQETPAGARLRIALAALDDEAGR